METFVFTNRVGHSTCFDSFWPEVTGQPLSAAWSEWPEVIHRKDQERVLSRWLQAVANRSHLDLTCELANGCRVRAVAGPQFVAGKYAGHTGRVISLDGSRRREFAERCKHGERRFFNPAGDEVGSFAAIDARRRLQERPLSVSSGAACSPANEIIGAAEVDSVGSYPVYLLPAEQVMLARVFAASEDARTWADTFNAKQPYGDELVAMVDSAPALRELGLRNLKSHPRRNGRE